MILHQIKRRFPFQGAIMNHTFSIPLSVIACLVLTNHAAAEGIQFADPVATTVTVTASPNKMLMNSRKQVMLMSFNLSEKQKAGLLKFNKAEVADTETDSSLPSSVALGMGKVPVLDQGMHGSCVTFAVTAAVNAALKKDDYISQLCQLELGSYLKFKGYYESGWNGAFAPVVYDQMLRFGIVNKHAQRKQGCAGIKEYPVNDFNEGNIMSPDDFRALSQNISMTIHPHAHIDAIDQFMSNFEDKKSVNRAFKAIKTALANGNRVTFGTTLHSVPGSDCSAGACATYKAKNDTWVLTDDIKKRGVFIGGHEMVITGYDDNATVSDPAGKVHTGLFTLRNSWGDDVGDKGNYYMTYEYFKHGLIEAHEVIAI